VSLPKQKENPDDPVGSLLEDYPVVIETPVAWGDMDAYQHVNNTAYFRYFENARVKFCEEIRFSLDPGEMDGIGFVLAAIDCRFLIPLAYPDRLSVGVRVSEMESYRFHIHHRLVSHTLKKVAAEGTARVVVYDFQKEKMIPIPKEVREQINELHRK